MLKKGQSYFITNLVFFWYKNTYRDNHIQYLLIRIFGNILNSSNNNLFTENVNGKR